MDHLFLLQFACFLFMLFNAFTLAVTRLQARWLNPRYERARWLIFVGIMGLAAHYLMQMRYGFRAVDDAVGATVNVLVYAPCFSLISMGIFHIEATHVRRRRVYVVCAAINLAIFACFFIGFLQHGEMRIGAWLYAMLALFAANVVYCMSSSSARSSSAAVCWRRWRAATSCPMYATPAPASSSSSSPPWYRPLPSSPPRCFTFLRLWDSWLSSSSS